VDAARIARPVLARERRSGPSKQLLKIGDGFTSARFRAAVEQLPDLGQRFAGHVVLGDQSDHDMALRPPAESRSDRTEQAEGSADSLGEHFLIFPHRTHSPTVIVNLLRLPPRSVTLFRLSMLLFNWWTWRGSNPRPHDCQSPKMRAPAGYTASHSIQPKGTCR